MDIAAECRALSPGGVLTIPPGKYWIDEPLDLRNKPNITIYGQRAWIRTKNSFSGEVVVDLCGSHRANLFGLRIGAHKGAIPMIGLLMGRTPENPSAARATLYSCSIAGAFEVATLVNIGAEVATYYACEFASTTSTPAYFDRSDDPWGLTGIKGHVSNVCKYFHNCNFTTKGGDADTAVILLEEGRRQLAFRDCYAGFRGGRGSVIRATGRGSTKLLTIDGFRVEAGTDDLDQSMSCLLDMQQEIPMEQLNIYNLAYTPRGPRNPEAVIRIQRTSSIIKSDIMVPDLGYAENLYIGGNLEGRIYR